MSKTIFLFISEELLPELTIKQYYLFSVFDFECLVSLFSISCLLCYNIYRICIKHIFCESSALSLFPFPMW